MDHGPLGAHFKPELLRSRFVSSLSINCNEHAFLYNSTWVGSLWHSPILYRAYNDGVSSINPELSGSTV